MVEETIHIMKQSLRKYMDIYLMIFDYATMRIMFGINVKFIKYFGYSFEKKLYNMESILVFNKKKKSQMHSKK